TRNESGSPPMESHSRSQRESLDFRRGPARSNLFGTADRPVLGEPQRVGVETFRNRGSDPIPGSWAGLAGCSKREDRKPAGGRALNWAGVLVGGGEGVRRGSPSLLFCRRSAQPPSLLLSSDFSADSLSAGALSFGSVFSASALGAGLPACAAVADDTVIGSS